MELCVLVLHHLCRQGERNNKLNKNPSLASCAMARPFPFTATHFSKVCIMSLHTSSMLDKDNSQCV